MGIQAAVQSGLDQLEPIDPLDRAAADLALLYAEHIDDVTSWDDKLRDPLAELGPKLLAALVQLRMTPAARQAAIGGQVVSIAANPLDELRNRRKDRGA
jgi:hypothetical protein